MHETKGNPDYKGSRDEIVRLTIEARFERKIKLWECCCGGQPQEWYRGEYCVKCLCCGRTTEWFSHLYKAKQAWNRKEVREPDKKGER